MVGTDALKLVIRQIALDHNCHLNDWWSCDDEPDVHMIWVYYVHYSGFTVGQLILRPDRLTMVDKRAHRRGGRTIVNLGDPELLDKFAGWLARFSP